ncbi:GGDEF domain-containing protein [Streptoalloteichus tenebrarius]|uniref:GGDEF domain-containing protein n=1 Tax=Streptoalloteichus tenebrarius (strain ATCC 17920 / DSM 40477 / JCM 4838 / CBS 697.72 / NBRC 16177 / NCIMB 11028 / NRRL B-12390 / A12253. 1 / ISP 5477) TaxID=1933 RepID=UPI0020A2483C|nr:GGDEF domain-containing protein [Streptoalloteichus tenebrarius]
MSNAWLVARARELIAHAQRDGTDGQLAAAEETRRLLDEAQRRGEPWTLGQVLRAVAVVRLVTPVLSDTADPVLDELLQHTRRHGLVVLESDAFALRGARALQAGNEDIALSSVATALAMLDNPAPDVLVTKRTWERLLATALVDIGLVLTQLGVHEMADEVLARAHQCIRDNGGPHEISVHLINRVKLLIGWGLRLERVGREEDAQERYDTAAAIAVAVEGPWRESLFPRREDMAAWEQMPVLGAAFALASPGGEHVPLLRALLDEVISPREEILVALALARCLELDGHPEEALQVLATSRKHLAEDTSEPALRLSLVREFARLSGPDGGEVTMSALEQYTHELESELWSLRQARIATLLTRLEHERLSRRAGAFAAQAFQDPLTGLPNRRALDEHLAALLEDAREQPLSVALVDLDGFKNVNDRCSHAEGDDVLRIVAGTLRNALRLDDVVTRYGGDEFVVLLPGAPLPAAEAALQRAVDTVAQLPHSFSRGVTLSVGVVAAGPADSSTHVLARADAAMYQAKRRGGNQIASGV